MKAKFLILALCGVALGSLASTTAQAATYSLSFSNNSALAGPGQVVTSDASFSPIVLFDGDTLSIVFSNVPNPKLFGWCGCTWGLTTLYGIGDGQVQETFNISGNNSQLPTQLGPSLMTQPGSITDPHQWSNVVPGWNYGPTWTITLSLLSGEPPTSSGLTVDQIHAELVYAPIPGALPLFATGLAGLGLLGWRRKKKAAPLNA